MPVSTTGEMILDQLGQSDAAYDLTKRQISWREDCKAAGVDPKMIGRVTTLQHPDQDKLAEEESLDR